MVRRTRWPRSSNPPSVIAPATDVRQKRIAGHDNIRTGYGDSQQRSAQPLKKRMQGFPVVVIENCKTREWRPLVAIKRWRNAPYAATALPQLLLFLFRVLDEAIGRISNNGMYRTGLALL